MRGFTRRTSVEDATRIVDERVDVLDGELCDLMQAGGRVVARDITSPSHVPAFRRAAMDGYAVIAEETFGATTHDPRPFDVHGESLPAKPAASDVTRGTCIRIMTGAPVPASATAVVPAELTRVEDGRVLVTEPVTPGRHIGDIGEDIKKGTLLFRAGRRLKPQDLGVLSSVGLARFFVVKKPRVSLIVTGRELLRPGSKPHGYSIVDANTPMLNMLVDRDGGKLLSGPIVRDDRAALKEAITVCAQETDVILISGGSSVGIEDHAPLLLGELGELPVHGVSMRPASPAGIGFLDNKPVFLLPGNPVSCLCAYDFFAGRAIRRRAGLHADFPHVRVRMPLARKISSELGRTDYARVRIEDGKVVPLAIRGASILSSTTRAHGFVIVPKDREGLGEGADVEVFLY